MALGGFFPVLVMAIAGWTWLRALDDRVLKGRLEAISTVSAHFDAELTDDLEALQRLASSVSGTVGEPGSEAAQRAIREVTHYFRHREAVFILDREGRTVVQEPRNEEPASGAASPVLADVLAGGRPRITALESDGRGQVIHELVPIRGWDGQIVGVAGGTFDPRRRDFGKMLAYLRRGSTGVADLVDARGHVIASTDTSRIGGTSECRNQIGELIQQKREFTGRCNECHWRYGVDVDAKDVFSLSSLTAAPWAIVVRQAPDEALPTEGAVSWPAVVAILLLQVGLTAVFSWGAARSVTGPVEVLTGEAERIAGGQLAAPIPDLGEDEVGRLGKSLDRMRDSLRGMMDRVARVNEDLERRVAERTQALAEANVQLKEREIARGELLRKVITAQEDERKRIARELHDETTQSLAVLLMGIESAMEAIRAGKTPRLDEVKAVATLTLEDVHRLILDLRPSVLDDLGLLSAIRWYAERTLETRGISVRCEFGEMSRLPPEMETALFRMCQEAMSNVARHAQASAVLVQVGVEGDQVRIEIEDDGKGFDPGKVGERRERRPWGLMGIRERAETLGGSAEIDTAPGQGTHLTVRIPLPKEHG
jgi:signal transduction histidine kinase